MQAQDGESSAEDRRQKRATWCRLWPISFAEPRYGRPRAVRAAPARSPLPHPPPAIALPLRSARSSPERRRLSPGGLMCAPMPGGVSARGTWHWGRRAHADLLRQPCCRRHGRSGDACKDDVCNVGAAESCCVQRCLHVELVVIDAIDLGEFDIVLVTVAIIDQDDAAVPHQQ